MATQTPSLGKGKVYFAPFAPGTQNPGAFEYFGHSTEFNLTIETEELEHENSDEGLNEVDFTIMTKVTRSGTLTTDHIKPASLARFFLGSASVVTTAAAAAQTYAIADVELGKTYQIGKTGLLPQGVMGITSVVVSSTTPAATYVLGVDYEVDLDSGLLTLLTGGTLTGGTDISVAYDLRASTRDRIVSSNNVIEGEILFVSKNPAGQKINFRMPYVSLRPNGDLALKSEEWQLLSFNLSVYKLGNRAAITADGVPVYA